MKKNRKPTIPPVITHLTLQYGISTEESRQAIIKAHSGIEEMQIAALTWAVHHDLLTTPQHAFVLYATAVDLGYRIAKKGGA